MDLVCGIVVLRSRGVVSRMGTGWWAWYVWSLGGYVDLGFFWSYVVRRWLGCSSLLSLFVGTRVVDDMGWYLLMRGDVHGRNIGRYGRGWRSW